MLRKEQNDLLTQTGPGTPMGQLFRSYWFPALLAEELPENDCPPVRVKMLSERLLAFRDSEGRYGLIDEFCAHRGVSLWFGRNEDCGLRCPYHGWKYDVTGQCIEVPSEPVESRLLREDQAHVLSAGEARPGAVDLYGTAGAAAAAAGVGVRHGTGRAMLHLQAAAGIELAAGDGRRHRFQPRLVPAPRRPRHRPAVQGRQGQRVQHLRHAAALRGGREHRRPLHRRPPQCRERQLLLAHHASGSCPASR